MPFNYKSVTAWFNTYLESHTLPFDNAESIIQALDGISIDKKTAWEDLVKNVLKIIDKERISFEPCNLPDDKNAVVIADRTAADIWQEIEKMDIGFRKYLTEYVGKRLNNYLSTIFDDVKIKNGKKGKNEIKYFIAVLGLTGILSEEMLVWIILRHADCVGGAVDNLQQQLSKIGALDKVSRETVFRIMFALQISLDDAREWLCYGFGGDDFDPRNLKEVIYCYALANNIHYKTKDEKVTSVESMIRNAECALMHNIFDNDSEKIRKVLEPNQDDNAFSEALKQKILSKISDPSEIIHVIVGCAIFLLPLKQRADIFDAVKSEQEFFNYCQYVYNLYTDRENIRIKHRFDGLDTQSVIDIAARWIKNIPFDNTVEMETYEMLRREVLSDLRRSVDDFIQYYVQNDYLYEKQDISLSRSEHIHELIESTTEQVNDYLEDFNRSDDCNICETEELSFFLERIKSESESVDRGFISLHRFIDGRLSELTRIADVEFSRSDFVRLYFISNACEKMLNPGYSSYIFKQDLDSIMESLRYSGYNERNPLDVLLYRCLDTDQPIKTYQTILNR